MLGQQPAYCKKKSFQIGISTLLKVFGFPLPDSSATGLCESRGESSAVPWPMSRNQLSGGGIRLETNPANTIRLQNSLPNNDPTVSIFGETFSGATGPTHPHCQHAAWLDPWKTGWRKICWSLLTRRYRTSQPELELIWPAFFRVETTQRCESVLNIYWKPLVVE